jgi:hypothetical protein
MTYSMRLKRAGALGATLLAVAALGGCFGGGDDDDDDDGGTPPVTDTVPGSAGATVTSFIDYLKGLAVSDTTEPLLLTDFTAPTSETDEPVGLN